MELAKPCIDIGLATNNLAELLAFWQGEAGLAFDHILPIRPGHDQHRHDALGSVVKINHYAAPLPARPPAGYRELMIAREGLAAAKAMADPDGNRVSLVPPGTDGVFQIGVRLGVRDLDVHRRFYADALGLPELRPGVFGAGQSLIILERDPAATADVGMEGGGWRYITFQVFDADAVHARVTARGGREALAPLTLGQTARISMVRDPDGNWIELSQRFSIVGAPG